VDAISERCGSCGAPRDPVDQYCPVCGTRFDGQAPAGGLLGRAVRAIVGVLGGIALLYVGVQLVSSLTGDPLQALAALVVGGLCLGLGGLAIGLAITRAMPHRARPRRSRDG
jgi:hypothetical protein